MNGCQGQSTTGQQPGNQEEEARQERPYWSRQIQDNGGTGKPPDGLLARIRKEHGAKASSVGR